MTKDQEAANAILTILGRIQPPNYIYAGSEVQVVVDIHQWLSKIASGETVVTAPKPPKPPKKAKPGKKPKADKKG